MNGDLIVGLIILAMIGISIFLLVRGRKKGNPCYGCKGGDCKCCSSKPLTIDEKER